jgi:hypothetical protein
MYEGDLSGEELQDDAYNESEDIAALEEARQMAMLERLESLTQSVLKKRGDAINGKKNSGIEEEWAECEDAYQGIDDANRQSSGKPLTHTGGAIGARKASTTRSTAYINITRPYVDSAAARIADILLPTDDRNWGIKPTPMPDIVEALGDPTQVADGSGNPIMFQPDTMGASPAMFGGAAAQNVKGIGDRPKEDMPQGGIAAPQGPRPLTIADLASKKLEDAATKAGLAEKQIDDWHVECGYHAEVRKVIEDASRLGTGVLKGPVPKKITSRFAQMLDDQTTAIVTEDKINPASVRVSPAHLFPDPNCGESIHNGSYLFEKDFITLRQVRDLAKLPGYFHGAIEKVLEEGPKKKYEMTYADKNKQDDERYEIWYYYGFLDKEDMDALGMEGEDVQMDNVPVILTLINDSIIKAAISPIESGEFPYDVFVWQRRQDEPWGIGVAKQVNTAQRMLNAATRNMLDNAGLSAGPQIVMRKGVVTPADGSWEIKPRKIWYVNEDSDSQAVNQAFMAIQIPSMQQDLNNIIQFSLQMAEHTTGMPLLMQGQSGQIGPAAETVGGMTLLMNNASTVLRRLARTFDDAITTPHIKRYYEWLMMYGEDDAMKGDYQIDARGSSALVERDIQNQAVMQMGQLAMNPAFGVDPKKWFAEACKAQRLDPKRFMFTPEELQQMQAAQQQQQKPVDDTPIKVAQIKAETELKKAEINAQLQEQRIATDQDRDTAYVAAQGHRDQIMAQAKIEELRLKRELALIKAQSDAGINNTTVKAKLASDALKLKVQKELSTFAAGRSVPQVSKPLTEPAGRAGTGQAYQK